MKQNRDVAVICVAVLCVSGSECCVSPGAGTLCGLSWPVLGSVRSQLSLAEPRLLAWQSWSLGAEMARYNPPQVWVLIMSSADWSSITAERGAKHQLITPGRYHSVESKHSQLLPCSGDWPAHSTQSIKPETLSGTPSPCVLLSGWLPYLNGANPSLMDRQLLSQMSWLKAYFRMYCQPV